VRLPACVGTFPALRAAALVVAVSGPDRALREQNLLNDLDGDLPLHHPPTFGSYFAMTSALALFAVIPVLC
jgi:hypothetical protein